LPIIAGGKVSQNMSIGPRVDLWTASYPIDLVIYLAVGCCTFTFPVAERPLP